MIRQSGSNSTRPDTPPNIIERNRKNAAHSTGPRTSEGKAVSRANSTKHGLCANPAEGTIEDPAQFEALQAELVSRIQPSGPIEAGLVHRIAVCIWRLQRAAKIDAAVCGLSVTKIVDQADEVRQWIERINWTGWYASLYPETDQEFLRKMRDRGKIKNGEKFYRYKRPWLSTLDEMRTNEISRSGAALTAMGYMLSDLTQRLENDPEMFLPTEAQQLAWVLGESAERLRIVEHEGERGRDHFYYPDSEPWASETDKRIGEAREREKGTPLPPRLEGMIRGQNTAFRQQRIACEDPRITTHHANKRAAALLPDAVTLDRLLRYETHADRALQRSLETLAKLRGAAVETISACLSGHTAGGSTFQVRGERTSWASADS